jgi:phage terminase large subunit
MKINRKYRPILSSSGRYFIVTGGRGSGKSFSVSTIVNMLTQESGHVILFTRYTMKSAGISIIPEFTEKIELLGWEDMFNVTKDEIVNTVTGSKILFRGIKTSSGNQVANLKSLQGVTTWILDEAEELVDEEIFDTIDLSVRQKGKLNRVIMMMNPATKEHFIYKRFFQDKGVPEGSNGQKGDTCYIHTTYLDNIENLSESYLRQIENIKRSNIKKYTHKILGGWLNKAEGVVFENWSYGAFNPKGLQTSCGMDFGFSVDPDTLTEVAIDKVEKKIYLKQHIYSNGLKTHELARRILTAVGQQLIVADSASPRTIEDLKHLGCNITGVKKGTIESGVSRMQDFELILTEDSVDIAKELNNHVYADKSSKLYVDSWNHAIDGIRYNLIHHLDNPNAGVYAIH